MDYSMKSMTTDDQPDDRLQNNQIGPDTSSSPPVERAEGTHPCPACPVVLSSSRELTNHLRDHNSPRSTVCSVEDDHYTCGVCHKVLSSASSLDRHVLVHSGERPFKCKHCDMAFTTNGNMNRHQRTAHRGLSPSSYTDSDMSNDSDRILVIRQHEEEYNNNEIAKRNSPDTTDNRKSPRLVARKRKTPDYVDEEELERRFKILLSNSGAEFKRRGLMKFEISHNCPVCNKRDFGTMTLLESHIEQYHPEYVAICDHCHLMFRDYRILNLHRFMVHFAEQALRSTKKDLQEAIEGFRDLTFVDFSSEKFTSIARDACERLEHRPASGEAKTFLCSKCQRAFPCKPAVESHEMDCGVPNSRTTVSNEDQTGRDHFLASLNLQNKAILKEAREGRDLADIQSIISVTAGPILQRFPRSDSDTLDINAKSNPNVGSSGSSGSSGGTSSEYHDEELQGAFAAEYRKMKLRGEFPCKLCTAIFPNLRALKGHNRAHLGVGPGTPYPCNLCAFTSPDKAATIKHLRLHNGDRPYECALCHFAFTTKANCERHVRNRHGILTREDVKSALIYNPTADPANNIGRTSPKESASKEETCKSLSYLNTDQEKDPTQQRQQQSRRSSMINLETKADIRVIEEAKLRQSSLSSMQSMVMNHYEKMDGLSRLSDIQPMDEKLPEPAITSHFAKMNEDLESRSSNDSVPLVNETKLEMHQRIQASPINLKKHSNISANLSSGNCDDLPLDLSMDALDLRKKTKSETNEFPGASVNRNQKLFDATNQLLLTQALLKASQTGNPHSFETMYANAHLLYRNLRAFPPGVELLQPYLFAPNLFDQNLTEKDRIQKEFARGLQLTSGGSLVQPTIGNSGFGSVFPSGQDILTHSTSEQNSYPTLLPSQIAKVNSLHDKVDGTSSSNSVKMVIKNGVLMQKQKQRRYRTERPFACEHCSARFTLRSNMERHVKQQHPQHWSQRPRGGHSTRGRPPANPPTMVQNITQQPVKPQQLPQQFQNTLSNAGSAPTSEYSKHAISDQVKYAILAQQLKGSNKPEENDTEGELVIDEGTAEKETSVSNAHPPSLLRIKLEDQNDYKQEKKKHDHDLAKDRPVIEDDPTVNDELKLMETEDPDNSNIDVTEPDVKAIKTESGNEAERDEETEKNEDGTVDLASVSKLLDNASQQYQQFQPQDLSDEEGTIVCTSASGSDDKSEHSMNSVNSVSTSSSGSSKRKGRKKKSAYSTAPNRVICPYCQRPFPWSSSLRRHILTHTGQKPYQCNHCNLPFTTKSNCDRHLLRKHKANPKKMRQTRHSSSPQAQVAQSSNNMFSMRNVPERPYKCNQCPSSTFSTLGNLKKHRSARHSKKSTRSRPSTSSCQPRQSPPQESPKQNDQSEESQSSTASETAQKSPAIPTTSSNNNNNNNNNKSTANALSSVNDASRSRKASPRSSPGPADAPFKCHLCDNGFSERQDCLEHIKTNHKRSYEMLVAKGALDMDIDASEDQQPLPSSQQHPSDGEEKRGKFPDYSNRKVVCAFCMRRFWSAEDLRRHMRTHTGERPFSCDICCRRFTLKHSMLRHRKKHESVDSPMYMGNSGDEEIPTQSTSVALQGQQQLLQSTAAGNSQAQDRTCINSAVAAVVPTDAAPSEFALFGAYNPALAGGVSNVQQRSPAETEVAENTENDLISNLLGIRDKSIIDKVLQASAHDAAKLLGVKSNQE